MRPDPAIEEIRRVRHEISARFNHDPRRLIEYYIKLQKRHQDRITQRIQISKEKTTAKA